MPKPATKMLLTPELGQDSGAGENLLDEVVAGAVLCPMQAVVDMVRVLAALSSLAGLLAGFGPQSAENPE